MADPAPTVRNAEPTEQDAIARLWFDGWRDAHATIAPPEIARHRTFTSFHDRLTGELAGLRVIGPIGDPDGFAWTIGDELYQFYVHARARGTGTAAILMADAERRLASEGTSAWLACAIGNERAARFYAKNGWSRAGVMTLQVDLPTGPFPLDIWRYEKGFAPVAP